MTGTVPTKNRPVSRRSILYSCREMLASRVHRSDGSPPSTNGVNNFAQRRYNPVTLLSGDDQRRADLRGWINPIIITKQDASLAELIRHPAHQTRVFRALLGLLVLDELDADE